MSRFDLQTVGNLMRFECALCGKGLEIDELMAHAQRHTERDECLRYSEYDCASRLDSTLEGYPLTMPDGTEVVWPFRLDSRRLNEIRRNVPRAG
ncbi:MAG: hypothetical protein ABFE08_23890 [Armatimonadia bacterium]